MASTGERAVWEQSPLAGQRERVTCQHDARPGRAVPACVMSACLVLCVLALPRVSTPSLRSRGTARFSGAVTRLSNAGTCQRTTNRALLFSHSELTAWIILACRKFPAGPLFAALYQAASGALLSSYPFSGIGSSSLHPYLLRS